MFRFEDYTLDVVRGSLQSGGREIELRPKSFEVLRYLVENAGRLVSKDELIKTVWPNVIVTDDSLARCISEVRQAIGDNNQTMIRTVPRRGYRFAATVTQLASGAAPSQQAQADFVDHARAKAEVGELSLSDRPSIAVLPFANLSGDIQQDYFSD